MVQIYLISVLACVCGGVLLLADQLKEKYAAMNYVHSWYANKAAYQPFIFCLFCIIGVLTLIFPYNGIPVLGDFIPGILNICTGLILFLDYYEERSQVMSVTMEKLSSFFGHYKSAFGAISLIAGLAHFLFPGVIFI